MHHGVLEHARLSLTSSQHTWTRSTAADKTAFSVTVIIYRVYNKILISEMYADSRTFKDILCVLKCIMSRK
jgi:hypothetical protein